MQDLSSVPVAPERLIYKNEEDHEVFIIVNVYASSQDASISTYVDTKYKRLTKQCHFLQRDRANVATCMELLQPGEVFSVEVTDTLLKYLVVNKRTGDTTEVIVKEPDVVQDKTPKTYILFHDDSDGFCSAISAYRFFKNNANYIRVQYGESFPDIPLTKETVIYIVDFSYKRHVLDNVHRQVKMLKVIDHHKTAEADLKDCTYATFDMERAGAVLTWQYFYPRADIPRLMTLVEDRDLWKFNYPDSSAFEAGIKATGRSKDLAFWHDVFQSQTLLDAIIEQGRILVNNIDGIVKEFVKSKKFKIVEDYCGHRLAVYNTTTLISEIGSAINLDQELMVDYTLSYFFTNQGNVIFSFRSGERSGIDVSQIAKKFGGGGHPRAAGANMTLADGTAFLQELYGSK